MSSKDNQLRIHNEIPSSEDICSNIHLLDIPLFSTRLDYKFTQQQTKYARHNSSERLMKNTTTQKKNGT